MTPVLDEKEKAVRALRRSINQYMRTGSNSSSGTDKAVTSLTEMSVRWPPWAECREMVMAK